MINQNLKKTDDFLAKIAQQLNLLKLVSPVNLQIEKEKFFSDSTYNPQFEYAVDLAEINKIEEELTAFEIEESGWQGILLNELKTKFLRDCDFAKQIGGNLNKFSEANQKKYILNFNLSDQEILLLAESEIENSKILNSEQSLNSQEVKNIFENFLEEKKINWKIVIDQELVPLLSMNYFSEQIHVNPLIQLSEREVKRMLVHEIETHLYRHLNGKNLFQMASIGLDNYEKTAEGLAAYNESLIHPEDKSFLERFYLRYKSVLFGEQNSFCKLYEYLHEYLAFDLEESWRIAVRVKRGIADTSFAGAFLKDKIYLQGYFAVRNLTLQEIKNLYKGKFSLEHLTSKQFNLDDDNLIAPPKYLPAVYSNLNA